MAVVIKNRLEKSFCTLKCVRVQFVFIVRLICVLTNTTFVINISVYVYQFTFFSHFQKFFRNKKCTFCKKNVNL